MSAPFSEKQSLKTLPKIDALYWLMIVSANTIGESGGDLISQTVNLGYAKSTALLIGLFAAAVVVEVATRFSVPSLYWIVIILSSTAGTTMSDLLTRNLFGTPENAAYGAGTLAILVTMLVVFALWRVVAPRTRVGDPMTRAMELVYWAAIVTSSTLGTAFGDFIANGTPLGFGGGSLVLIAVLVIIILLTLFTRLSREVCYWAAIVVTHPLGATMGDYMTKREGFNLGNFKATVILAAAFVAIATFKRLRRSARAS